MDTEALTGLLGYCYAMIQAHELEISHLTGRLAKIHKPTKHSRILHKIDRTRRELTRWTTWALALERTLPTSQPLTGDT
jgi:hypothetical protein